MARIVAFPCWNLLYRVYHTLALVTLVASVFLCRALLKSVFEIAYAFIHIIHGLVFSCGINSRFVSISYGLNRGREVLNLHVWALSSNFSVKLISETGPLLPKWFLRFYASHESPVKLGKKLSSFYTIGICWGWQFLLRVMKVPIYVFSLLSALEPFYVALPKNLWIFVSTALGTVQNSTIDRWYIRLLFSTFINSCLL